MSLTLHTHTQLTLQIHGVHRAHSHSAHPALSHPSPSTLTLHSRTAHTHLTLHSRTSHHTSLTHYSITQHSLIAHTAFTHHTLHTLLTLLLIHLLPCASIAHLTLPVHCALTPFTLHLYTSHPIRTHTSLTPNTYTAHLHSDISHHALRASLRTWQITARTPRPRPGTRSP